MKVFNGNNYSKNYYDILVECSKFEHNLESRVGNCFDLGTAYISVNNQSCGLPFVKGRGLNIFFAIMEAAWILSGSNKLSPLEEIISNYHKFSDDKETLNGAYGYRIFNTFGFNQLEAVIEELRNKPNSRRAVISLYSADDLNKSESLDIPCNLSILFKIRSNKLEMTVLNRSNDAYKGIPYNLFVFRAIQYYVAKKLSLSLGEQRHFTDSLHLYEEDFSEVSRIIESANSDAINIELDLILFDEIIQDNHNILELNWERISSERLRWLFTSFALFKKTKDAASFKNIDKFPILSQYIGDWLKAHYNFTLDL